MKAVAGEGLSVEETPSALAFYPIQRRVDYKGALL